MLSAPSVYSSQTLKIIENKKSDRLKGNLEEWRRLKSVYKVKSKADLESYHSAIADEAEGLSHNNLRPSYRAIKLLDGGQ